MVYRGVLFLSLCSRDRDRSNSVMVRKRSASFRKISRQKRKEEAKDDSKLVVSAVYFNHVPLQVICIYDTLFWQKRLFTPPENSPTNLRLSSTIRTYDVVQMLLSKFKVSIFVYAYMYMYTRTCLRTRSTAAKIAPFFP